jgi:hypothetical protein
MTIEGKAAGWILFLVEVGHSMEPHPGMDFQRWADKGYGIICRIQHAWGTGGTYPHPQDLPGYLQRVKTLCQNSRGCERWIIGNEPNLPVEWPDGQLITPQYTSEVYNKCMPLVKGLALFPPIAPWNDKSGMGWIEYFARAIDGCPEIDAFSIHTYSRGPDPASITDPTKMDPPYQMYYNGFLTYRDWLNAIPARFGDREVHITETDQDASWLDEPNTWAQAAYDQINKHNQIEGNQKICSMILYRWPKVGDDKYWIEGKGNVHKDYQAAVAKGYTWTEKEDPPVEEKQWIEIIHDTMDEYHDQDGEPELTIPVGNDGEPYSLEYRDDGLPYKRPECDKRECPETGAHECNRGVDPEGHPNSAAVFMPHAAIQGALRRTVPVAVGTKCRARVRCWIQSKENDSDKDGAMGGVIGVDPTGGDNYLAGSVVYGDWFDVRDKLENQKVWTEINVPEAVAQTNRVSVFLRFAAEYPVDMNAIHWDNMHFEIYTDEEPPDPEPPIPPTPGNHTITTITVTQLDGVEIARSASEAQITCGGLDPEACELAQRLVARLCPST